MHFTLPENDSTAREFCLEWLKGAQEFHIYTSGSTGTPKCITIKRHLMEASARMTQKALNLKAGDKALLCMDTSRIAGKMMLVRSMVTDMNLTTVPPSSNPLKTLSDNFFDFTAMVPLQLHTILTETPEKIEILNEMKAILVGGAKVNQTLHRLLQKIQAPVYSTYGMTETVSHIALQRLNGPEASDYFEAMEGVEIEQDSRGCLVISSPTTDFRKIVTNDMVEIVAKGKFIWLGRADNIINSGGIKICSEQLEEKVGKIFQGLNLKRNFIISGATSEKLGETVTLVIEGDILPEETENNLMEHFKKNFPKYEGPKLITYLDTFPYTPSGNKIDRPAIKKFINDKSNGR